MSHVKTADEPSAWTTKVIDSCQNLKPLQHSHDEWLHWVLDHLAICTTWFFLKIEQLVNMGTHPFFHFNTDMQKALWTLMKSRDQIPHLWDFEQSAQTTASALLMSATASSLWFDETRLTHWNRSMSAERRWITRDFRWIRQWWDSTSSDCKRGKTRRESWSTDSACEDATSESLEVPDWLEASSASLHCHILSELKKSFHPWSVRMETSFPKFAKHEVKLCAQPDLVVSRIYHCWFVLGMNVMTQCKLFIRTEHQRLSCPTAQCCLEPMDS